MPKQKQSKAPKSAGQAISAFRRAIATKTLGAKTSGATPVKEALSERASRQLLERNFTELCLGTREREKGVRTEKGG